MLRALALVLALGSGTVLAAASSVGAVESTPFLVVSGAESYEAGSDACFTVTIDGAALSGDALLEVDQADPLDVQFLSIVDGTGTACFSSLGPGDFETWAMWLGENAYVEASARVHFSVVGGSSQVQGSLSVAPTASAFADGEPICFDTYGTDAAVGQGASLSVHASQSADADASVHTDAVAPAFNPQSLCLAPTLAPGEYVVSFALDDLMIVAEPAFFTVTAPASSAVLATPQMALLPSSVAWNVGAAEHLAVTVSGGRETPTGSLTLSAIDGLSGDASAIADAQLSGGTADFDLSKVPVGPSALVVTYSGDASYSTIQASVSVTVSAQASSSPVVRAEPTIALSPREVEAGASVLVTISVSGRLAPSAVPTGGVTVHYGEGDADQTTLALSDAGTATVEMQFGVVGTTTLRVDYAGDGNFAPASQSFPVRVNATPASDISSAPSSGVASSASSSAPLIASQLSASADPESVAVGGLVDLIGHLHAEGTAPTGTITFYEDDTAIASTSALNAIASGLFEGRAQAQFLTVEVHSIRAVYSGDTTYSPAEANFQVIVIAAAVSSVSSVTELPVLIVSGEQSVAAGADACFAVTASSGGPSGDALLEVTDGHDEQTTVAFALQGGTGSVCVNGLAAGEYSAIAMSTSEQLAALTSEPFRFTVEAASSAVVLETPQMSLVPTSIAWNVGAPESLSASVYASGGTPTGRVTLHAIAGTTGDDTTIGDATLRNGVADFDLSTVPAGTATLVVEYAGDAAYSAVRSSVSVTVSTPAPSSEVALPTPTITLLPRQAIRDAVTQVTVAVTAPEGVESIPSGQIDVAFGEDDTPLPTLKLGGNGAVTQLLRFTVVGSTTVKIIYRGDLNFAPASTSFDVAVIDPASDVSSVSSPSEPSSSSAVSAPLLTPDFTAMSATEPVVRDTPVDLIGQIRFSSEAPTGNVKFFENTTQIAFGGLTGLPNAGLAEWRASASFATAGAHHLLAVYSGDERYASAQHEFVLMVVAPAEPVQSEESSSLAVPPSSDDPAPSSASSASSEPDPSLPLIPTLVNAGPATAIAGVPVELTALVTDDKGASGPSGDVQFFEDEALLGRGALADGVARATTTFLTAGVHTITARYRGDERYQLGSTRVDISVSEALSSSASVPSSSSDSAPLALVATAVVGGPSTATVDIATSLRAEVSAASGGTPTGKVEFMNGDEPVGTVPLFDGVAELPVIFETAGAYTFTANYLGDDTHAKSSVTFDVTVSAAVPPASEESSAPSEVSSSVIPPVSEESSSVQPAPPSDEEVLSSEPPPLPSTSDEESSLPSEASSSVVLPVSEESSASVRIALTATAVVGGPSTATVDNATSLHAVVSAASGGVPTGKVEFMNGDEPVGTVFLADGVAELPVIFETAGVYTIMVNYLGDDTHAKSSVVFEVVVSAAVPVPSEESSVSSGSPSGVIPPASEESSSVPPAPSGDEEVLSSEPPPLPSSSVPESSWPGEASSRVVPPVSEESSSVVPAPSSSMTVGDIATRIEAPPSSADIGVVTTLLAFVEAEAGGAPTGEVEFVDGETSLGSAPLQGQVATLHVTFGSPGSHSITATYAGDATHAPSSVQFDVYVNGPSSSSSSSSSSPDGVIENGDGSSSSGNPDAPSELVHEEGSSSSASSSSSSSAGDDEISSSSREDESSAIGDDGVSSSSGASSEDLSSSADEEGVSSSSSSSSSAAPSQPAGGSSEDGSSSSSSVVPPAGPSSASSSASSTPPPVQTVTMKIQLSHITDPNGSIENSMTAFFSPSGSGDSYGGAPQLGYAAITPERAQLSTSLSAINVAAGNQKRSPLDLWLDGTFGLLQQGTTSGSYFSGHAGVSYLFTPNLLAGTAVSLSQVSTVDGASRSSSLGVMLTPYVGAKLSDTLFANGYAGYGLSQLSLSPDGTYTDAVLGRRWLVGGSLSGQFRIDNWLFAPMLSAQYGEFATDAYVDGHGGAVAASLTGQGVLSFAPRLSVDFRLEDGTVVTPNVTLGAGIGVANDNGIWTSAGLSDSAALGLAVATTGGATFDARLGATGLIAGDFKSVNARVGLKANLH